jgi:hypothetical protein
MCNGFGREVGLERLVGWGIEHRQRASVNRAVGGARQQKSLWDVRLLFVRGRRRRRFEFLLVADGIIVRHCL